MKYTSFLAVLALVSNTSAIKIAEQSEWAPVAPGPYASHTDHLSAECYGADDDDGQSAALNAADYLQRINQSQTLEELQANYNFVMGEVKNDRTLSKMVIEAKDKRKAEL